MPLFHCFGCVIGVLGAFTHGACLCAVESFDARRVLETIERERCTALYGVPTMFLAELEDPEFDRFDLSSLRTGVMAGALCPEPLMRRVIDRMHLPRDDDCVRVDRDLARADADAARRRHRGAHADRRARVCPRSRCASSIPRRARTLPVGERGELWARGYVVMKGYYNMPEQTGGRDHAPTAGCAAAIRRRSTPTANVRITGRIKDLIIRGGENIAPKEIEDVLRQHPAVADVSVYGISSEFFGEEVAAAMRPQPGASIDARGGDATSARSGWRGSKCRATCASSRRSR